VLRARAGQRVSLAAPHAGADAGEPLRVTREGRWLVVRFAEARRAVSWAVAGGGFRRTRAVAWLEVADDDLCPPVNAAAFLRARLTAAGLSKAVGLLTSRDLDSYVVVEKRHHDVSATCIATVGLGNALRAGDLPGPIARIGTINVVCHVSVRLTDEALLEALALAAEARTLAVREANVPSRVSGNPASGTGTDCIVIAAPERGRAAIYAGKHTSLGHVIGASVHDAVRRGIAAR
jgi:adenosylcobinamide amidohydrolase